MTSVQVARFSVPLQWCTSAISASWSLHRWYCLVPKELARELRNRWYDKDSRQLWQEWMAMAKDVGVPLLNSAARTLHKRLYGILNVMKHRVSNGNTESLNSKIKLLRIKPGGYRNKKHFKVAGRFHYGRLNMAL
ncbi:hypothetical protein AV903_04750 [Erwinia tracheiphila]|uniref:Transposase IS204/IS1001/IS1096/IS1165 DDE domain-containing protein n=1 Tax=Erwinia tracheiphila TaxID=65700 RepID=A0A345CQ43_9GAMM|nr:hypothetical protein AV903_04750 [Erwinia tracheiphila]